MVLGRCPNHGRTANINVLDRLIPGDIRTSHRFPEGIQVHHHQINQGDLLLIKISPMGSVITLGQDSAVDPRVQGFHPAAKNLRCPRVLSHLGDRQTCIHQHLGGAATGEQLVAMLPMKRFGQRHQACFVGDA